MRAVTLMFALKLRRSGVTLTTPPVSPVVIPACAGVSNCTCAPASVVIVKVTRVSIVKLV